MIHLPRIELNGIVRHRQSINPHHVVSVIDNDGEIWLELITGRNVRLDANEIEMIKQAVRNG